MRIFNRRKINYYFECIFRMYYRIMTCMSNPTICDKNKYNYLFTIKSDIFLNKYNNFMNNNQNHISELQTCWEQ